MATLELKQISKSFGTAEVLYDIDLEIRDKEFVVFVGPSGSGKSTLLRIVAGLEQATQGQISIDGVDVSNAHPLERGIAMVFQSYALYPHLTVYENIAFPLRVAKTPKDELDEQVKRAAEILQLTEKLPLKPGQLSGGQRQRVAIGRSIVRKPKVFLFDEPLSNLDAALRGDMRVELSQLHKNLNTTMIYVTHDQVEAMTMADRVVVLNEGRVEQFDEPMNLYHHPATNFVAGFIGQPNMNFLDAKVRGVANGSLTVDLAAGPKLDIPVDSSGAKEGDDVTVGVRPEDVSLGDDGFRLDIHVLERLGGVALAHGALADATRFCAALEGNAAVVEGAPATISINPADVHVFNADGSVRRRLAAPKIEI